MKLIFYGFFMFNSTLEAHLEHLKVDVFSNVWKTLLLYMAMAAVVPVNRSGRELDVLESLSLGVDQATVINPSRQKGHFPKCYLWLALRGRKEGAL